MAEYINKNESVDESYLQNWYIDSVDEAGTPHWTEEHIEELVKDFIVIPVETSVADVEPVRRGRWIKESEHILLVDGTYKEWNNFYCSECDSPENAPRKFCAECGAKMEEYKSDIT